MGRIDDRGLRAAGVHSIGVLPRAVHLILGPRAEGVYAGLKMLLTA
jgi:hypothetical protein